MQQHCQHIHLTWLLKQQFVNHAADSACRPNAGALVAIAAAVLAFVLARWTWDHKQGHEIHAPVPSGQAAAPLRPADELSVPEEDQHAAPSAVAARGARHEQATSGASVRTQLEMVSTVSVAAIVTLQHGRDSVA
jgi:hypothetical protein